MVHIVEEIVTDMDGNRFTNILPGGIEGKFKVKRSVFNIMLGLAKGVVGFAIMMSGSRDDETVFSKHTLIHSKNRKIVRFEAIPLDFVKNIKNAAGVSINDVLYTCISQAIHDYLLELDDPVLKEKGADILCRTLLPIALPRGKGDAKVLRNNWCFLSADYAVGLDDIQERLAHVHATLSKLKQSLLPLVIMTLQNYIAPYMPLWASRKQLVGLVSGHSTVFSNVPGPPTPCKFAGYEVQQVQMVFSNLIAQIGLLSYRGQVFGNFCLNPEEILHSDRLPILVSKALVSLASRFDVSVPHSIQSHADTA